MPNTLHIGLILPDVLGTYGDDGNALVLRQRARMRGWSAEIHRITLDDAVPESYDLYCLGGGEDTAQILAAEHLKKHRGLSHAVGAGKPLLAICAGFQVLGESFRAGNRIVDGVGLLDARTVSLSQRAIDEVASTPTGAGVTAGLTEKFTGFENHMGATILGADAQPLGTVFRGVGNCDSQVAAPEQASYEGAVQGSILATYMHGPALARNPQLADLLLAMATGQSLESLPPLELPEVERLRQERLAAQ